MAERQSLIQPSFAAGELSPAVQGRVDLAKYKVGAAKMRNFFALHYGGAATRAGTIAIGRCKQAFGTPPVFIDFIFSTVQAYVLEFGNLYMRVLKDGGYVLETAKSIAAVTQANPGVFTVLAHGYVAGDWLYVTDALGMTEINSTPGKQFIVATTPTVDTFTVTDLDGTPLDTSAYGAYGGAGLVGRIYTLTTPYLSADLSLLKYVQSADTLTLTHPSYAPRDLTRTGHANWTLTVTDFAASVQPPTALVGSPVGNPVQPAKTIVSITNANPGTLTVTNHGYNVNDTLYIFDAVGMTEINSTRGNLFKLRAVGGANTFTLNDLNSGGGNQVDTTSFGVYVGNSGQVARYFGSVDPTQLEYYYVVTSVIDDPFEESVQAVSAVMVVNAGLNQDAGVGNKILWTAPATGPAPDRYYVYRTAPQRAGAAVSTTYGYIGHTGTLEFVDTNFAPDFTRSPPLATNPFAGGVNPSCSTYYDGRRIYAAPMAFPQTLYGSVAGNYNNMDVRSPVREDDAFTYTLNSRQVNAIKHLFPTDKLIAFTSGGAWAIGPGSNSDFITPLSVQAKPQAYNGCSDLPPLGINYDILYVQARGGKVRDLTYNFYVNLYTGNDLSVLSNHFFYGYTIIDWCYAEEPFYQVHAVRNDGAMLAFTYLKEQDVYAWSRYDTPGSSGADGFVACASIPEDNENAVYVATSRAVPGVNGGNPVYFAERFASRNFYVDGVADVRLAWCVDCGAQYSGVATTAISGLDHLNGAQVTVLADGSVQGPFTVSNGSITLDNAAALVTTGLAYECILETLPIDTGEPTIQGKRKKISRVSAMLEATRGLQIAPLRMLTDDNYTPGTYTPIKERSNEQMGDPVPLFTGMRTLLIEGQWQARGAMSIKQAYPLPATILSLIPEVTVGDN
jgi:hypothetical protein